MSPSEWLKKFNLASPLDGPLLLAADWRVQDSQGRLTLRREAGDVWVGRPERGLWLEQAQLHHRLAAALAGAGPTAQRPSAGWTPRRLAAGGQWFAQFCKARYGWPSMLTRQTPAAWATWLPPGMRWRTAGRQCQPEGSLATLAGAARSVGEALAFQP